MDSDGISRRDWLKRGSLGLGGLTLADGSQSPAQEPAAKQGHQFEELRWIDERQDPSVTLETTELVAKVIDNTGLRPGPQQDQRFAFHGAPDYSHYLGYHGIRSFWRKDERRNIVVPGSSWLNLQGLRVDGLKLDPVDVRSRAGIGRGWPLRMDRDGQAVVLKITRMPVSGIEYSLRLKLSGADSLDFEVSFTLHQKTRDKAAFYASWPCYMSTFDEIQLFAPMEIAAKPVWKPFGEKEPFIVGESVQNVHTQRRFEPSGPLVFPAVYGRIGSRVLSIMVSRPEVHFFVVNAGGHHARSPIQNPAWDFSLNLPDYEAGKPFGFRGRLIYESWRDSDEIVGRYQEWQKELSLEKVK